MAPASPSAPASWVVAALVSLYMGSTISAAVRTEEAFLRSRFGDEYAAYAERRAPEMARRFSLERAWRNKEYRALAGLVMAIVVLGLKAAFRRVGVVAPSAGRAGPRLRCRLRARRAGRLRCSADPPVPTVEAAVISAAEALDGASRSAAPAAEVRSLNPVDVG